MTDLSLLPRPLQLDIARVNKTRLAVDARDIRRLRVSVIKRLRKHGLLDAEIARLLGVTQQYLGREFPRKENKP